MKADVEASEALVVDSPVLDVTGGLKQDSGKLRFDLMPAECEEAIVDILTKALEKYPADNWKQVSEAKDRYYAAARRHMAKMRMGEIYDEQSKQLHSAHAACNLVFILWFDLQEFHTRDRGDSE